MTLLVGQNTPTSGGNQTGGVGAGLMYWYGGGYVAVKSGTATQLKAYVVDVGSATVLQLAIYDNAVPPNLLAFGSTTPVLGLNIVNITPTAIVQGNTYHIPGEFDHTAGFADDGTTFHGQQVAETLGSPPATLPNGTNFNIGISSVWADDGQIPTSPDGDNRFQRWIGPSLKSPFSQMQFTPFAYNSRVNPNLPIAAIPPGGATHFSLTPTPGLVP